MLPTPKLIATDLDGTLLRADESISPRTIAALRDASARGIHIAIATARPFRALPSEVESAAFGGWAACQNGAIVYDLARSERVLIWELDHLLARRIVEDLRHHVAGVAFAIEMDDLFHCEPAFGGRRQTLEPAEVNYGDALDLITGPLTKLLVHHASMPSHELAASVASITGEHATVTHSGAPFVEISAAGITKAFAIAALCEQLGIQREEVIAFGDMPNDLAMLEWAGYRVAVANAHPDVIAAANEIAPSNDEDGVAAVIERILTQSQ